MANDVAFSKLSVETTIGIGTAARYASSDLHTCLLTEEVIEVQEYLQVAGLPVIINNTCLMKHLKQSINQAEQSGD